MEWGVPQRSFRVERCGTPHYANRTNALVGNWRMRPKAATALVFAALVAWLLVAVRMRGMDDGPGTELGSLGWYLGIWVTMMAAMMLPSATPMVMLFAKVSEQASGRSSL